MYEPAHYSSDSQDEDDGDEDIGDLTDYEGYNYEEDDEDVEDEEEEGYDDEESEQTLYSDEDYSEEEPEIVCSPIITSSLDVKLRRRGEEEVWCRVRRRVWDLMVLTIAFSVAVMLGFYSMM